MKIPSLTLLLLLITACATQTTKQPDWAIAELPASEITAPDKLLTLCEMVVKDDTISWTTECWQRLVAYEITAKGNTDIATANSNALRATQGAYTALYQAGLIQQSLSEFYKQELEREQRDRFVDGLFYKTIIGLGIIFLP